MWYIAEYYLPFKKEILTYGTKPRGHYAKNLSQSQKDKIMHDSTYMRYLK